ncbi:MAG: phospholipase [Mariniblastus sp.]|nr:phospholipase [Mariniblastus sp.]
MRHFIFGISMVVGLLMASSSQAQKSDRPCGPESLKGPMRLLIPQGAAGIDFRVSCKAHDECYVNSGSDRSVCDCQFRDSMLKQCEQSRNPRRCRRVAKIMYRSVRKYGDKAFEESQSD